VSAVADSAMVLVHTCTQVVSTFGSRNLPWVIRSFVNGRSGMTVSTMSQRFWLTKLSGFVLSLCKTALCAPAAGPDSRVYGPKLLAVTPLSPHC